MNKKVLAIISIIALVAILGVCLVACNADSYAKRLDKAGYHVETLQGDDAKEEAGGADVEWVVAAAKGTDSVVVIKFKNTDDAKDFEDNAVTGSAFGKTLACERSGKIVLYGTKDAVKAAK